MKRTLITLILLGLLSTEGIWAQNVRAGIRAGVNRSDLADYAVGVDARTGFTAAIPISIYVADFLAIQPEISYSAQGANSQYQLLDGLNFVNVEQLDKLDYINVPVKLLFKLGQTGGYLSGGGQVGYLFSAKSDIKYSGNGAPSDQEVDIKEYLEELDYGFVLGAGWEFRNGLILDFTYFLGQKQVLIEDVSPDDFFLPNGQNKVIQLTAGFMFSGRN